MIISQDIIPEKNLYYIGSQILQILRANDGITITALFDKYNSLIPDNYRRIDMTSLLLAIDWLFIIDLLNYDKEKKAIKLN